MTKGRPWAHLLHGGTRPTSICTAILPEGELRADWAAFAQQRTGETTWRGKMDRDALTNTSASSGSPAHIGPRCLRAGRDSWRLEKQLECGRTSPGTLPRVKELLELSLDQRGWQVAVCAPLPLWWCRWQQGSRCCGWPAASVSTGCLAHTSLRRPGAWRNNQGLKEQLGCKGARSRNSLGSEGQVECSLDGGAGEHQGLHSPSTFMVQIGQGPGTMARLSHQQTPCPWPTPAPDTLGHRKATV